MGQEVVDGRYELLEVLGREGHTEVVRAIDRRHDRAVALKVRRLTGGVSRDALLAEGRALLGMRPHPALPTVRDDFFLDDETYVLVMDWIEGTQLTRFVDERGDPGLPLGTVLLGLEAIAGALDHLHQHDPPIFHGDVRPENVLVGPGGRLTLVFGAGSTGSASVEAECPYRAPELTHRPANRAADVYELAATAVFALTGAPPPAGGPIEWHGVAPELAMRLDRVMRRALDPDPSRRPPSASDLVERLASARETAVPTGVVTFVLTDVEGSTDLWEAHPDQMQRVMMRHTELAADIAERHGGRMPRSQGEGDNSLTAYSRATDAINAVLAFQRAIRSEAWPAGIDLRVRAGLHTGEAKVDHGEYFGATLSRAARIRALARGGQVLLSQATAELVADSLPPDVTLHDLGRFQLKGLERAEEVYELAGPDLVTGPPLMGAATSAPGPVTRLAFPTTLHPDPSGFVDRLDQMREMQAHWDETVARERRHTAFVTGEPGIGKSRFTAELARQVFAGGDAVVLHGRCYEENLVPYQPFVEVIERVVRDSDPGTVMEDIARGGALLARLVPQIALRFPDLPAAVRAEPGTERYLMFEAVNALLVRFSERSPLLVVLEDLHWADQPTIALLGHLARGADPARLLLVGSYRQGEVATDGPLSVAVADLCRERLADGIELSGLAEEDVGALVTTCGVEASPEFVASVSRETAGNPFFVTEICSHVGSADVTGGTFTLESLGVPEGVKQVIGRRIARLPEGTERLLVIGATIGREFDLDVLVDVAGDDEEAVLDRLDEACAARLVDEVIGSVGRYSFVHALTRDALYDSLGATRRARLHGQVAEALERQRALQLDEHLGELAYHFARAATQVTKAVEYARRAGDRALAQLAHEEAALHFERGLALLEEHDRHRCDLLLGLAEARRRAGDVPGARSAFAEAGALARELGDAERLTRAAVGSFRGHVLASPGWHQPAIALLEDALVMLPDRDSAMRSRVLAALALELYFTPEHARGVETGAEAVAMARRLGDDEALAFALACDHTAISDPAHPSERLAVSTELIELGERLDDAELALVGHVHRACDLMEITDVDGARAEAVAAAAVVERLGQPMHRYFVMWLESTLALLEGRFDDAERLANEALDIAVAAKHPDAFVAWGTQAVVLAWQRGDSSALVEPARGLLSDFPDLGSWPSAVALMEALAGELDAARERLRRYLMDPDALTFGGTWTAALLALTEVARMVEEPAAARVLYDRLLPHADRICVVSLNLSELGPVSRGLGVLATMLGEHAAAERHFEEAAAISCRVGARAHAARTMVDHARLLFTRRRGDDESRGRAMLTAADAAARELGMAGLVADIEALGPS